MARAKRKNPNRAGTDARKRKDGRYETRATLNTPTGRKRVSFYGATAEEANNAKFKALADQARGVLFSDPGKLTTGVYLQSWLNDTARYEASEGTYSRYERTCRNHLVPFFGRITLRELSTAHVRAFKDRKIEEGLNPNTVGVMQGVLSNELNQAVDDGLIPSNPASRVKKAVKRERAPMRFPSVPGRGLKALRSRCRHARRGPANPRAQDRDAPGRARSSEVGGYRSHRQTLHHRQALRRHPLEDARLHHQDREDKARIHIGPRTVDVLKGHRARQLEERMAAASWMDPGLVFPNTTGKIRRRDSVMRSLRRFLKEAGLPIDVRFHDQRHTAGTLALRQGVPLHTVSRMLLATPTLR